MRLERILIALKEGHHRPASETPFTDIGKSRPFHELFNVENICFIRNSRKFPNLQYIRCKI